MYHISKIVGLLYLLSILVSCASETEKTAWPKEFSLPKHTSAILPYLTSEKGTLYLSWIDTVSTTNSIMRYASLQHDKWTDSKIVATGENWFINWADYPSISVNQSKIMSFYLKNKGSSGMAYDIYYNIAELNQTVHSDHMLLNKDQTDTEHGFVSMTPDSDSTFFMTWLDGRNMANNHDHSHSHKHSGAMNVRVAQVDFEGNISKEQVIDEKACTCCQTTTSMTANGPVVMYRDCTADDIRDIVIVRNVKDKWTKPKPIHHDNWFIQGCPVNGPKSDAIGNSLAVAWFTGANDKPKVQVIFSEDGGESFNKPILISDLEVLGRVEIHLLEQDKAIVSWMESKEDDTFLYAQAVSRSGKRGEKLPVAKISENRKTGFPQMEIVEDRVYFTWIDLMDGSPKLKMAYYQVERF